MSLPVHDGGVTSISYSIDGHLIGIVSMHGTVRIWDTSTGREAVAPLPSADGPIWSVAFSPNGGIIASGTEAGTVYMWRSMTSHATPQRLSGHSGAITCVKWSPDGNIICSASKDTELCLWSAETGELRARLSGHSAAVNTFAFSPDSLFLASGSEDYMLRLWRISNVPVQCQVMDVQFGSISCICFSPDGRSLVGSSLQGIRLWNVSTGQKVLTLQHHSDFIQCVQFSADGRSLVSADQQQVCIWTFSRFTRNASLRVLRGHTDAVRSTAFSPDNLYVASAADDGFARIWNTAKLGMFAR